MGGPDVGDRYAQIPHAVLNDKTLSPVDRNVYAWLDFHADREGRCWVSQTTLAGLVGRTDRWTRDSLSRLEKGGHISVERRRFGSQGQRIANGYLLTHRKSSSSSHRKQDSSSHRKFSAKPKEAGFRTTKQIPKGSEPSGERHPSGASPARTSDGYVRVDGRWIEEAS